MKAPWRIRRWAVIRENWQGYYRRNSRPIKDGQARGMIELGTIDHAARRNPQAVRTATPRSVWNKRQDRMIRSKKVRKNDLRRARAHAHNV